MAMKKRILLIKLTSLGDLLHALPALTDAHRINPEWEFDWLVDESFQEIASFHPAVKNIYTANHRKWRSALGELNTYRSIFSLIRKLRQEKYDLIIDGQGNFKTALLTLCMKGETAGYDRQSAREPIVFLAYQKTFAISKKAHAIQRLRELFAHALHYEVPTTAPDFLINREKFKQPALDLPPHFLLFVHSASWKTKLWPEEHWKALIKQTVQHGFSILLPWGNREEEERAKRLAISPKVMVLPKLSLSEIGFVIAQAKACVCVDTGLSHLAAALNIPAITLYGATDSGLTGANGQHQIHFQSSLSCAPCHKKSCLYPCAGLNPPCLAQVQPDSIFSHLQKMLQP